MKGVHMSEEHETTGETEPTPQGEPDTETVESEQGGQISPTTPEPDIQTDNEQA
jgi:hypothetical protein